MRLAPHRSHRNPEWHSEGRRRRRRRRRAGTHSQAELPTWGVSRAACLRMIKISRPTASRTLEMTPAPAACCHPAKGAPGAPGCDAICPLHGLPVPGDARPRHASEGRGAVAVSFSKFGRRRRKAALTSYNVALRRHCGVLGSMKV